MTHGFLDPCTFPETPKKSLVPTSFCRRAALRASRVHNEVLLPSLPIIQALEEQDWNGKFNNFLTRNLWDPGSGMTPKWGFGVAVLPVGASCFYRAHWAHGAFQHGHFGRISSTLYFTVFRSLGGHTSARRVSHQPCCRQAHCLMQAPLRFLPVPPNPTCARSHTWGFPRATTSHIRTYFPRLEINYSKNDRGFTKGVSRT